MSAARGRSITPRILYLYRWDVSVSSTGSIQFSSRKRRAWRLHVGSSLMILSIFLHRYPKAPVPVFQFALSYFASRIISKFRSFSEDPRLMERCSAGNYFIRFSGRRFEISEHLSPVNSYCFCYITVAGFCC